MAQSLALINDLNTKNSRDTMIKVRVLRIWPVFRNKKNEETKKVVTEHVGNEFVNIDSQGSKIVGFIKKSNITRFRHLAEGHVYTLTSFGVVNYTGNYRYCSNMYKILFYYTTVMHETIDDQIPKRAFTFVEFQHIINKTVDDIYLIDVIGLLTGIGDMVETAVDKDPNDLHKRIDIELQNQLGEKITCTLWDAYAMQFVPYLNSTSTDAVIVIIQFGKLRSFQNEYRLGNALGGTMVYIEDTNIPEIAEFKRSIIGRASKSIEPRITHIQSPSTASPTDLFLKPECWKSISQLELSPVGTKWVTIATIDDFEEKNGWFYNACKDCKKKLEVCLGRFNCTICKRAVRYPETRFRVEVRVSDETSNAIFVLFDKEVKMLTNKSVSSIIDSTKKDADLMSIPSELHVLLGNQYLFYVEVKKLSVTCQFVYTVSKISNDTLLIHEFLGLQTKLKQVEVNATQIGINDESNGLQKELDFSEVNDDQDSSGQDNAEDIQDGNEKDNVELKDVYNAEDIQLETENGNADLEDVLEEADGNLALNGCFKRKRIYVVSEDDENDG